MTDDVRRLIGRCGAGKYKDGSSSKTGFVYQPIPFDGYEDIQVHREQECRRDAKVVFGDFGPMGGLSVLDIGSNIGFHSFLAARIGAKVVGYEADGANVDVANALMSKHGVRKVRFIKTRIDEDTINAMPRGAFDVGICLNLHMWLVKQMGPEGVLRLMMALRKKVGILYFQTAHRGGPGRFTCSFLNNPNDIRAYLEECGWANVRLLRSGVRYLFRAGPEVTVTRRQVDKMPRGRNKQFGCLERERAWLDDLAKTPCRDFIPKLLSHDMDSIQISYEGERVTRSTLPADALSQAERILSNLRASGCCHNDIKPGEILVKNGRLMLCDFGWSTRVGEPIPSDWPPVLGGQFKSPDGFDDRYSFIKSLRELPS